MSENFSIVIPTYRRGGLLLATLASYLRTDARRVIVVDDASGREHESFLELAESDPRVTLIRQQRRGGLPRARNRGVLESDTDWIVFGEDDVWFPNGYAATLIQHARRAGASIASGRVPLVHPRYLTAPVTDLDRAIRSAASREPSRGRIMGARWPTETLSTVDMVTPLLSACAAVRRSVFESVRFDSSFTGNSFREETDFFLTCAERGLRTIHCPHAVCGHMKETARSTPGGVWSMSKAAYAASMLANNWRFIRRHATSLGSVRRAAGRSASPIAMQGTFVLELLSGWRPRRA
jgi:GT2 family glycosyltransferase